MKKFPVFTPMIGSLEKKYINDCLENNWIAQGSYIERFEKEFSDYCGVKYGVVTSNCTVALHLAGIILGLKKGDEFLVSASTNMASVFSMYYNGMIPVPVDIELETWQMDVNLIESKITEKTKAIVVVHLFGNSVDMDPIISIAQKYKLKIIEDCAEAHGVEYKGKKVGSFGDIACFSFYSNKIITCGEGGMILTNSFELAKKAKHYSNFCYGQKNKFMHTDIGYNYRLSNINAAMGLGQLHRIDEILEKKEMIYEEYKKNLKDIPGFHIPKPKYWTKPVMWMFYTDIDPEVFPMNRDVFLEKLQNYGIETRKSFVPVNQQNIFLEKGFVKKSDCLAANYIMKNGFYLPSGMDLIQKDIIYICKIIKGLLDE